MSKATQKSPHSGTVDCAFTDELLAFLHNELSLWRRVQIKLHVTHCPQCQETILEMERIGLEMRKLSGTESVLAPEMRDRLVMGLDGIQPDIPDRAHADRAKPRPLWKQKPLLVFGGGGVTVVASFLAFMTLYTPANQMGQESNKAMVVADMARVSVGATMAEAGPAPAAPPMGSVAPASGMPMTGSRDYVPTDIPVAPAASAATGAESANPVASVAVYGDAPANAPQAVTLRAMGAEAGEGLPALEERQVHREASVGVAVTSVEQADNQIVTLVESSGGFVANNQLNTDESGFKFAELTIKVPVKDFGNIVSSISKLGDLRSKSLTGEDITEKVSDATSDEQVLMDEAHQLSERLKQRDLSEKRISQTEGELRSVRMQLARTRARLGLLRKLSSLSTIQISLTEKAKRTVEKPTETGLRRDLWETNRAAMAAFQAAIRVPLVMLVWILAFSPLWVPLILAYRWAAMKNKNR